MSDLRELTLSEARHQLNTLPKYFESENAEPIIIRDKDEPVMAIMAIEMFLGMGAAIDYIKEKDLMSDFMATMLKWEQEANGEFGEEETEEPEYKTKEDYFAALSKRVREDAEYREEFQNRVAKKREMLNMMRSTLEEEEALLQTIE